MKKIKKYPKFEDYDFSDCREITGDELYRINGGGRIQPEQNENPPEGDSSNNSDSYTVQSGDTLSQIVYDYNQTNGTHLTVDEVAALSGIDNPDLIHPGQDIIFGNNEQGSEPGQGSDPAAQGGQNPQSQSNYSTPNVESSSSTGNASAYNTLPVNQTQTFGGTGIINESQNVTISDSIGNLTEKNKNNYIPDSNEETVRKWLYDAMFFISKNAETDYEIMTAKKLTDMMNNGKVQLDDTSKRYLRPDFPVSNEGEFYGFFDPYKNTVTGESRNIIVLDTKNIINDGYGRLIETLAHEGWHAVQYEYGQIITNSKNTLDYTFPYDDLENAASYVGQRMYNKYINQNRL